MFFDVKIGFIGIYFERLDDDDDDDEPMLLLDPMDFDCPLLDVKVDLPVVFRLEYLLVDPLFNKLILNFFCDTIAMRLLFANSNDCPQLVCF